MRRILILDGYLFSQPWIELCHLFTTGIDNMLRRAFHQL
jgi:hypothetical protein